MEGNNAPSESFKWTINGLSWNWLSSSTDKYSKTFFLGGVGWQLRISPMKPNDYFFFIYLDAEEEKQKDFDAQFRIIVVNEIDAQQKVEKVSQQRRFIATQEDSHCHFSSLILLDDLFLDCELCHDFTIEVKITVKFLHCHCAQMELQKNASVLDGIILRDLEIQKLELALGKSVDEASKLRGDLGRVKKENVKVVDEFSSAKEKITNLEGELQLLSLKNNNLQIQLEDTRQAELNAVSNVELVREMLEKVLENLEEK